MSLGGVQSCGPLLDQCDKRLRINLTRSPRRLRTTALCAFRTAEALERCSAVLYNQRARPVPRQQRAAALGSTSLPPVRASMDCLIKVRICTRPFRTDGPRHNSSGL
jgi:hypothetical protein